MENNMTKETQEEIVEENNEEIREDMELDILFTPDEELNATFEEVEVKAEETETLESREAVFPLEFRQDETNDRTMEMSISSESPVARSFGLEVLSHREGDIDLTRLMN